MTWCPVIHAECSACADNSRCVSATSAPSASTPPAPAEDRCSCQVPGSMQSLCVNGTKTQCMICHRVLAEVEKPILPADSTWEGKTLPEPSEGVRTSTCSVHEDGGHRHPNSARFHELLKEAGELHDLKQSDYGQGDDPFANVRASEDWGIDGWIGTMMRATDKIKRLQSLASKGYLNNEAAIDSFMDIAVYALIARVLYEQELAKGTAVTVDHVD